LWNTEVIDVLGADKVEGLKLRNTVDGSESERAFTGLFVAIGHIPRSELITGQIDLDNEGYVICEGRSTRTNQKGVFACGDLVDHTYRQPRSLELSYQDVISVYDQVQSDLEF